MAAAYTARGASGFGAAVALPLLGLVLPLKVLVPAWTLIALAASVALLGEDRKHIAWKEVLALVPGTLVGIAAGLYVFTRISSDALTTWLGIAVLLYGIYSLIGTFRPGTKLKLPPAAAPAVGGLGGGMTGAVLGTMGSVFYAMYFDAIRLAKEQYRASMTAILFFLTVVRGIGYWSVGEFDREVLAVAAMLFVPMMIGLIVGSRFHHGMSDLVFRRTVSGALIASGLALLIKSL